MKRMVVKVGYDEWALETAQDAVGLLGIFQRAVKVKQHGYNGPYLMEEDQTPPFDAILLTDLSEKVDVAAAASDEIPF